MQNEEKETDSSLKVFWWEFLFAGIIVALGIILAVVIGIGFINFLLRLIFG